MASLSPMTFFEFYEFTKEHPSFFTGGLAGYDSPLGMSLGNIFSLFGGEESKKSHSIKTDRFYNDPPEFFTVLFGDSDGLHWGYYFDHPDVLDPVICSYYSNDAFEFSYDGITLFEMLRDAVESMFDEALANMEDPEYENSEKHLKDLDKMRDALMKKATAERPETGEEYVLKYSKSRKVTAKTREGMGIVVPEPQYWFSETEDRFQQWDYKPKKKEIKELESHCMDLLKNGYPGNLLKLGKDLWIYKEFRDICYGPLERSYLALGRTKLLEPLKVAKEFRIECDKKV